MTSGCGPEGDPIRAWAQWMRDKGALGPHCTDEEVLMVVIAALERAHRDHEEYKAERHGRSRTAEVLRRYQSLIAEASPSATEILLLRAAALLHPERKQARRPSSVAVRRLRLVLGNGQELDEALSFAEGREVQSARNWAAGREIWSDGDRASGRGFPIEFLREDVNEALQSLSAGQGARRGLKFFSVLELGFAFVKLTSTVPTFTTRIDSERGSERVGDFAEFVIKVDAVFPIAGRKEGFDAIIPDVLAEGRAAFEAAMDFGRDPLDHPPFGSASFARAK